MTSSDHSRYLKGLITQINEEGLNDDFIHMLCIELKSTHLDNPHYQDAPIYLQRGNKHYLILYTDHDYFMNDFPDWSHSHTSFDWYLEILDTPVYCYMEEESQKVIFNRNYMEENFSDGIILNMNTEEFIIEGELLDKIRKFFKIDLYTVSEIREKFENMDNSRLDSMLLRSPPDWDEIIREMGNSTLLYLVDLNQSDEELRTFFCFFRLDPFGFKKRISLYTTKDVDSRDKKAVIVNLITAVDYVLSFGQDELKICTPNLELSMSRNLLIEKYCLIKKYCNDKKLKQAHECLFNL